MARTWQSSRWRRPIMQAVMWLILGATVGLAALVGRTRSETHLADKVYTLGVVQVRVPRGWYVESVRRRKGITELRAVEPRRAPTAEEDPLDTVARVLIVIEEPLPEAETVPHYLGRLLGGLTGFDAREQEPGEVMEVAGTPGLFIRVQGLEAMGGQPVLGWSMYACTILPSRVALTLRLEGVGEPSKADRDTLALIAKGAAAVYPDSRE